MSFKNHPFFKAVGMLNELAKKGMPWGGGNCDKQLFYKCLEKAHPFVFDKKVTYEKITDGRSCLDSKDLVKDFSLPFKTSLYLLTKSPEILTPLSSSSESVLVEKFGYLIHETKAPTEFVVFEVYGFKYSGKNLYFVNQFLIDLNLLKTAFSHADALGFEIFSKNTQAHVLKETSVIFHLTNSISVKRIGIEKVREFSIKTKDLKIGSIKIKQDSIVHIADKEEYEYVKPIEDSSVNWKYTGFWRGHWRAFYFPDEVTDSFGRRVVDFEKVGKNREGEFCVPGYTWVVEHFRGDKSHAEIKTRVVKNQHGE